MEMASLNISYKKYVLQAILPILKSMAWIGYIKVS